MFVTVDPLAREYDALIHFTPTVSQRKQFAKQGVAMPGGSFYIRNASDLDNAITAVGRATPNANESETARRNAVRRHIMERARFLKLTSKIPDTWNSDGTLKHSVMQGLHPDAVIIDEFPEFLADLVTDEFLEHFGVKGMKWGVRRAEKRTARSDRKFAKAGASNRVIAKVYDQAAGNMNSHELPRLNNDPRFKDKDFTKDSPLRRKYYGEVHRAYINSLEQAASDQGTSKSGNLKYTILEGQQEGTWRIVTKEVKHADESIVVHLTFDSTGHITGIEIPGNTMTQAEEIDEFLAHFGVKGMRWGVRRSRSTGTVSPSHTAPRKGHFPAAHVPASRRVGMPKQHRPVADDAARTLQIKSQLSKHGPQSLSNSDLQHLVKRMQLEKQLSQLDPVHKTTGRKVVDEAVKIGGNAAKQTAAQFAAKYAAEGAAHLIKLAVKMK